LDHELKAAPLLTRLQELTTSAARRRQVSALLGKVTNAERTGAYNLQPFRSDTPSLRNRRSGAS
jgi:hypothetical protein